MVPGQVSEKFREAVKAQAEREQIGELRKVEWPQVDLKAGEIWLEKKQTKGKKPRTIPIYGEMRPWLEMQKAERDQKWPDCRLVFRYLSKPIGSHLKGFVGACEARAFRRFASMI
jgi:integrase